MSSSSDRNTDVAFMNGEMEVESKDDLHHDGDHSAPETQGDVKLDTRIDQSDVGNENAGNQLAMDLDDQSSSRVLQLDDQSTPSPSPGVLQSFSFGRSRILDGSEASDSRDSFYTGGEIVTRETSDSRDSFSTGGEMVTETAMEVDVVTSVSNENQFQGDNSDETDTIGSLDSHKSEDYYSKPVGFTNSQLKPVGFRKPKSKGTPWIPVDNLPHELDHGYRILRDLMGEKCKSFNWPFLDPVDVDALGLWDYHDKVKQPMWLRKIQFKFINHEYQSITEFVSDVRVVLENCYRYNGMKHWVSKQAQTLESTLQQKLTLLPRELQEKTTLFVTSRGKYGAEGASISTSSGRRRFSGRTQTVSDYSPLATAVRKDLDDMVKENKRQEIINRKEELQQYQLDLIDWEKDLMQEDGAQYMGSLWEIPFIGHFLYMCSTVLCMDEVCYYELERAFAAPKESSLLRKIYTSLLCTPYQRKRLDKKPTMPYKVWEAKLREYVRSWYVVLDEQGGDADQTYTLLGISPQFFDVLGERFPMDHKRYHELTFYERVWVMKALCDYIYATQAVIRRTIDTIPIQDQRQLVLGYDKDNNAYIHFPQFCGADLRIYRQVPFDEPEIKTKKEVKQRPPESKEEVIDNASKIESNNSEQKATSSTQRARPSRLRKKINPVLRHGVDSETGEAQQSEENSNKESNEKEHQNNNNEPTENLAETCDSSSIKTDTMQSNNENNSNNREYIDTDAINENDLQIDENKTESIPEIPATEKVAVIDQSDNKLDNKSNTEEDQKQASKPSNNSDHKPSNSEMSLKQEEQTENDAHSSDFDKLRTTTNEASVENGSIPSTSHMTPDCESSPRQPKLEVKGENVEAEQTFAHMSPSKPVGSVEICWSPPRPNTPLPEREEVVPPVGEFELVCGSIEELRALIKKFSGEPEEIVIPAKGKKKAKTILTKPPRRKRCEIELHEKLVNMLIELEPWEAKLIKLETRTREKLNKELIYFETPNPEKIIKDVWASEEELSSDSDSGSDSDSTSDSDSDSSEMDTGDLKDFKIPLKIETAAATAAAVEGNEAKPKIPDPMSPTAAIVESVLEHEIPARRTRLARKRHIHMLKSAKKAAAKAATKQAKTGIPSKKVKVTNDQNPPLQPVQFTLGNGPGSLSSSLPMYSTLKSSNLAKTNIQALRFQNSTTLPGTQTFVLQQPAATSGSTPTATAVLTKPQGSGVRYMSLQELAKINPALAQTISSMSIPQQQGGAVPKSSSQQVLGTVPGVTCIMKSPPGSTSASLLQPIAPASQPGTVGLQPLGSDTTIAQSGVNITQPAISTGTIVAGQTIGTNKDGTIQGTAQLPQGVSLLPTSPGTGYRPATQIVRSATNLTTARPNTCAVVTQPTILPLGVNALPSTVGGVNTLPSSVEGVTAVPSTVGATLATQTQQLAQASTNVPIQATSSVAGNTPTSIQSPAKTTFTITVDTNMWKQLQGKPQLQQQIVLNHIRQQQLKLQQQAGLQGKVATSPLKTVPGTSQGNLPQQLGVSPVKTILQTNVQPQALLQQQLLQLQNGQQTSQQQTKHIQQTPHQPAQQIIRMRSPQKLQSIHPTIPVSLQQLQTSTAISQLPPSASVLAPQTQATSVISPQRMTLVSQQPQVTSLIAPQTISGIASQSKLIASQAMTIAPQLQTTSIVAPQVQTSSVIAPHLQPSPTIVPQLQTRAVVAPQILTSSVIAPQLQTSSVIVPQVQTSAIVAPQLLTSSVIAPQLNQQQSVPGQKQHQQQVPITTSPVRLTHTQPTQQQNQPSNVRTIPSSPLKITLPIHQKPGAGGTIQLTAEQKASIKQQLLQIQQQQQLKGRKITFSPSKGLVLNPSGSATQPKPVVQTPTASIQNALPPGITLSLSPNKLISQQRPSVPGATQPSMITVPLGALLNRQQTQPQVKRPPLVYVLPSSASQGSQGLVLQGTQNPVVLQNLATNQAGQQLRTQNQVVLQNLTTNQAGQQLQTIGLQNISSQQLVRGAQITTMQNSPLSIQPIVGQQTLSTQGNNVLQVLNQLKGQANSTIVASQKPSTISSTLASGHTQQAVPSNVTLPQGTVTLSQASSALQVGQTSLVSAPQVCQTSLVSAPQVCQTPLTSSAPQVTPQVVTSSVMSPQVVTPSVMSPQVVTPNVMSPQVVTPSVMSPQVVTPSVMSPQVVTPSVMATDSDQVKQAGLSAQEKSAQQTYQ